MPSFVPETIFDVDHRNGKTFFYRSQFQCSAWSALLQAYQSKGKNKAITSERACAELPLTHPLVRLVADEHVFRLGDTEFSSLDGDSYVVELTHPAGVVEFETWATSLDARWHRLLDALEEAIRILPKAK